jgi:hypothetical protein
MKIFTFMGVIYEHNKISSISSFIPVKFKMAIFRYINQGPVILLNVILVNVILLFY